MDLGIQDWFTGLLGFQSLPQFGAQQVQIQSPHPSLTECSAFLAARPDGFEKVSLAVAYENLAVIPTEWSNTGVGRPWFSFDSHDSVMSCMDTLQKAAFISFHDDFLQYIGPEAKLEEIHGFSGEDAQHVHEAPAYLPITNELLFADTSVIGWLWALEIDTHKIRKVKTEPPLENVNGATTYGSQIYLTTNGGRAPAIWSCTAPRGMSGSGESVDEAITCTLVVNNYRFSHLNSPNDLIFTTAGNILFTDPTYGWTQSWPGVGPPELPTAIYHFNTKTRALITLDNDQVLQPNGLALSADEKTLYIADSNSTSGKPIGVWNDSVRNVYAFDFNEDKLTLQNRRLVHVVESGWPDGVRVARMGRPGQERELVLAALMGGIDIVDASRGGAGALLGKWNVGDDVIFNLEPVVRGSKQSEERLTAHVWLLTGKKGVYKVTIAAQG